MAEKLAESSLSPLSLDAQHIQPYTGQTSPGYIAHAKRFPDGHIEATILEKRYDERFKGGGARKNGDKSTMDEKVLARSRKRAKSKVRETSLMLQPDRLLTLTYRENMTGFDEAWRDFKAFVRKVRKRYPNFHYVAVPELQKRGAIHFHVAIKGYYHATTLRNFWRSIVGEGNIDITDPGKFRRQYKSRLSPAKIAAYIAKYISKQDIVSFNKRRYSTSSGIPKPEKTTCFIPYSVYDSNRAVNIVRSLLSTQTRKSFQQFFEIYGEREIFYISTRPKSIGKKVPVT